MLINYLYLESFLVFIIIIICCSVISDMEFILPVIAQKISDNNEKKIGYIHYKTTVNGIIMHYVIGGKGDPVVLLHGWPET